MRRLLSWNTTRVCFLNLHIHTVGNDIEAVSQSAADIHTSCLVKNKDIRKVCSPPELQPKSYTHQCLPSSQFLDGVYVEEKVRDGEAELGSSRSGR